VPWTRVEEADASVTYEGGWLASTSSAHSAGRAVSSMGTGVRAVFHFVGTAVRWVGWRDQWSGIGRVSIDGQFRAVVDTYVNGQQAQSVLFTAEGLTNGAHTLEVEVTGTKNAAAAAPWVWTDAFDVVGRAVAAPASATAWQRIEESNPAFRSSGGWLTNSISQHSGGSALLSMGNGTSASVTFAGTAVRWVGWRDAWSGIARVSLDGVDRGLIDTYATGQAAQAVLFTAEGLTAGVHTLKVEVTGTKCAAASATWVWVDAFDIAGTTSSPSLPVPTPVTRVEQSDATVRLTGGWMTNTTAIQSGGTAAFAMGAGARSAVTFSGTGVRWIGWRDRWSGIARVWIDGTQRAIVDTYVNGQQAQAVLFVAEGLARGAHTIEVEVTGDKNPAASAPWVWVDAFDTVP
jgi:hypothetical protein